MNERLEELFEVSCCGMNGRGLKRGLLDESSVRNPGLVGEAVDCDVLDGDGRGPPRWRVDL